MSDAKRLEFGEVRHNEARSRFELPVEGSLALADYRLQNGVATFFHTETPPALQGRGVAAKLIHGALEEARRLGWKVRPTCSFVVAYFRRHPDFSDLLE